jgi:hypothetical protein
LRRLKPVHRDAEQKDMGARSVIAVVVCIAAATALAAVADGALVLFLDQLGQELPIATTPNPDVSAAPGRPAPRPLLTAVVRAPRQTTELASSELPTVVTGGTGRAAVGKMAKGSGAGRDTAEGSGTARNSSATFGASDEIRPQLGLGSSGRAVADLQTRLNASGSATACDSRSGGCVPPAPLNVDGKFGPKTLARIREFQRANELPSDGIVGPQTWKKLVTP